MAGSNNRFAFSSIATGALILLACELPWILALVGLSGGAAAFSGLAPGLWLEAAAVLAILSGLGLWLWRRRQKLRTALNP